MTERIMFKAILSDIHGVETRVPMSPSAEVLHVEIQQGAPTIWFIDTPDHPQQVDRRFLTIWTGRKFNVDGLTHVGTAVGERLISHIFEVLS